MVKYFPCEVAKGLYVLGNRHFFSFLVTGERHALVEMGVSATAPLVASQVAALGIKPEKVGYLVVPHAHFDHLGGLPYFRGFFPEAVVLCSAKAREIMAKPRVLEHFFREDAATSAWLEKGGEGQRTFSWLAGSTLEAGVVVGEGDILDLGHGSTMKFYAAPGHSPCSLAVYLPERDTLLVSDSLGFFLGPEDNFPIFFHDYRSYLYTIRRLSQIRATAVAAAHEYVFMGDEAARCFTAAEDSAERLCNFIATFRGDPEEMVGELYGRYYRDGLEAYSPQNIKACLELLVRRVSDARRVVAN